MLIRLILFFSFLFLFPFVIFLSHFLVISSCHSPLLSLCLSKLFNIDSTY